MQEYKTSEFSPLEISEDNYIEVYKKELKTKILSHEKIKLLKV